MAGDLWDKFVESIESHGAIRFNGQVVFEMVEHRRVYLLWSRRNYIFTLLVRFGRIYAVVR